MLRVREAVAEAADGAEVVSRRAEFAADPPDLGVHDADANRLTGRAEALDEILAKTDPACLPGQLRQQPELGHRERQFLSVHRCLVIRHIQTQGSDAKRLPFGRLRSGAPKDGANPEHGFAAMERPRDDIVRPRLERALAKQGIKHSR